MKNIIRVQALAQSVSEMWQQIVSDPFTRTATTVCLFPIVLSLGLIAWKWNALPIRVPLWYSRAWGEDQLAHPLWLLVLPVGSLTWLSLTLLFSQLILKETLYIRILLITTFLVSVLSFFTLVRIVFLVG